MEKYAQDNFNVQKRGLFRKRLSIKAILSWTTDAINKPLTSLPTDEKSVKKEAVQAYRLIQIYMGDRKAKPDMTINTVAFDITTMGYNKPSLRDEIFVQLCKQTTDNPKKDSLRRGWELMAICLAFFPPSATFAPFLQGYIAKHRDSSLDEFPDAHKWPIHIQISHYAGICAKRLERIGELKVKCFSDRELVLGPVLFLDAIILVLEELKWHKFLLTQLCQGALNERKV